MDTRQRGPFNQAHPGGAVMRYLTVKQAAEMVPYDPQTIKKCCAKTQAVAGELPPLEARKDMRGRWIVTDAALGKWMEAILNF